MILGINGGKGSGRFCKFCDSYKSTSEFSKNSKNIDKLSKKCKCCSKLYYLNNKKEILKKQKEYYIKNKETINKRNLKWASENRDKCNIISRRYTYNNLEKERARKRKYEKDNPEKVKARKVKYSKENKHILNAKTSRRRLHNRKATPNWLSDFDKDYISHIYQQSNWIQELEGVKYNVDHIIPLKNELVCGLNVPWNLQILTKKDNSKKHNKFDGTYENESWRSL